MSIIDQLISYWSGARKPDPAEHFEIGIGEDGRVIYGPARNER